MEGGQVVRCLRQFALDVFDDHHRRVHQHADGDGQAAQAHQIGREAEDAHENEGGQGREGQHDGDHQGRAQVAEKGEQEQDHQHDGLQQGLGHGADGPIDQVAAIVKGLDGDALGQGRGDLGQPGLDALDHRARIGAAQAEDQALDGLPLAVLGDGAITGQGPKAHLGHVADAHHQAVLGLQDDGLDVVHRADGALGAHQQGLLAIGQAAGAVVAVVGLQDLPQILEGQAPGDQELRVGHHLEGPHLAAQAVDIGHARYGAQLRADDPIEEGALLGQRQVALDGEHEHLAEGGRDGGHAAGDSGWQVAHGGGQALADLLAGPINVGAVLEIDGDIGQGVLGGRAEQALIRDAEHFLLDGDGQAGFDLLRRHAGGLEDDLDLGRGDIGKGVDGQTQEGLNTRRDQQDGQDHQQEALGQGKANQGGQHYSPPAPDSMALRPETPFKTTRSPAWRPATRRPSPLWPMTLTGRASKLEPLSSLAICTKA